MAGGRFTPEEKQELRTNGYSEEMIAEAERQAMAAASGQDESEDRPLVWLPEKTKKFTNVFHPSPEEEAATPGFGVRRTRPKTTRITSGGQTDATNVANWVYDESKRKRIEDYLLDRGFDWETEADFQELWRSFVQEASLAYEQSGIKKSPWEIADMHAETRKQQEEAYDPYAEAVKGRRYTHRTTQTQIDEFDPATVKGALNKTLSELIGRAPSDEEIEDFASRAAGIAAANPRIAETETELVWDPDLQRYVEESQTTETSGGLSTDMLTQEAEEDTRKTQEYADFQAATFVYNWVQQALDSVV